MRTKFSLALAAFFAVGSMSACTVHHVHSYRYHRPTHVVVGGGIGQPLPAPRLRARVPAYRVPVRRVPARPVAPRRKVCRSNGRSYYC